MHPSSTLYMKLSRKESPATSSRACTRAEVPNMGGGRVGRRKKTLMGEFCGTQLFFFIQCYHGNYHKYESSKNEVFTKKNLLKGRRRRRKTWVKLVVYTVLPWFKICCKSRIFPAIFFFPKLKEWQQNCFLQLWVEEPASGFREMSKIPFRNIIKTVDL